MIEMLTFKNNHTRSHAVLCLVLHDAAVSQDAVRRTENPDLVGHLTHLPHNCCTNSCEYLWHSRAFKGIVGKSHMTSSCSFTYIMAQVTLQNVKSV